MTKSTRNSGAVVNLDSSAVVPTLIDRDKSGGEIAETGLSVQENVQLCRLPAWLSQDGFTQMIRESYGDCEARFFRPGLGYRREFVEVKDRVIQPSAFWQEIDVFHKMEKADPNAYERFVLYAELSAETQPIRAALDRVRKAIPFYSDVTIYSDANYTAFVKVVVGKGGTSDIAAFLFEKVFFSDFLPSPSMGEALFIGELTTYFPESAELPKRLLASAYSGLRDLMKSKGPNVPITRKEIEAVLLERTDIRFPLSPLCVHTCGNSEPPTGPIVLRWESFFGGADRSYPDTVEWNEKLLGQLFATREWIKEHRSGNVVVLRGERRLTGAFAIGATFSAVSGFVVHHTHRDGELWKTDDHPKTETPLYPLVSSPIDFISEPSPGLVVSISILGDIGPEVDIAIPELGLAGYKVLHLRGTEPVVSAAQANRIAIDIKERIREALRTCGVLNAPVHLFYKGPSHIALFLGHRLNAVASINCYEWVGTNQYLRTCTLSKG